MVVLEDPIPQQSIKISFFILDVFIPDVYFGGDLESSTSSLRKDSFPEPPFADDQAFLLAQDRVESSIAAFRAKNLTRCRHIVQSSSQFGPKIFIKGKNLCLKRLAKFGFVSKQWFCSTLQSSNGVAILQLHRMQQMSRHWNLPCQVRPLVAIGGFR